MDGERLGRAVLGVALAGLIVGQLGLAHGAPVSEPPIALKKVGLRRERPPRASVLFDLRVRGADTGPRWVILPARVDVDKALDVLKTDGVEVWTLKTADGATVIGRFQGTGGFVAIPIPKKGELVVHGLALATWGATPSSIEVATAADVRIGGEPIDAWIGAHSAGGGESQAESAERGKARFTPDRHEVDVTLTGATRHRLAF